jgi:hypothetical protein
MRGLYENIGPTQECNKYCDKSNNANEIWRHSLVVTCKKYARNTPAGTQEFPCGNSVVDCPLCGELRRYRPSEVHLGFPDSHLTQQQVPLFRAKPPKLPFGN